MRGFNGARPPVAKFLNDCGEEMNSDQIYKYVLDIVSYYASEYKSDSELREQLKIDLSVLAQSYILCKISSGNDNDHNNLLAQFELKDKPNKALERNMKNLSEAICYLIREAIFHRLFLEPIILEKMGLKKVSCFLTEKESIYDFALFQYKIHDYVPKAPFFVMECFCNDRDLFETFYRESKGCSPEQIAANFYNLMPDVDFLKNFNSFKPLYDFFINPKESDVSYSDFKTDKPVSERTWRRYMNKARETML